MPDPKPHKPCPFVANLYSILQTAGPYLHWVDERTFVVTSDVAKARLALQPAWHLQRLSSFIRQLSYYGFKRLSDRRRKRDRQEAEPFIVFTHPSGDFMRGRADSIHRIQRLPRKKQASVACKSDDDDDVLVPATREAVAKRGACSKPAREASPADQATSTTTAATTATNTSRVVQPPSLVLEKSKIASTSLPVLYPTPPETHGKNFDEHPLSAALAAATVYPSAMSHSAVPVYFNDVQTHAMMPYPFKMVPYGAAGAVASPAYTYALAPTAVHAHQTNQPINQTEHAAFRQTGQTTFPSPAETIFPRSLPLSDGSGSPAGHEDEAEVDSNWYDRTAQEDWTRLVSGSGGMPTIYAASWGVR